MRCETCLKKVPVTGHCRDCHLAKFPMTDAMWNGDDLQVEIERKVHKVRMGVVSALGWLLK